jgi:ankyrin repeat protein
VFSQDQSPDYDLLMAADLGKVEYVRVALIQGASIDTRSDYGVTPLMYASQGGHIEVVSLLLVMGAKIDIKPYGSNETALMSAIKNGYYEVAELLIISGADFTLNDLYERSIMHLAALSGVWESADMLLYYDLPVDVRDEDEKTPLMYAAFCNFDAVVRVFIVNNANVNLVDFEGNSALHFAAIRGGVESAKELINAGINLETKNEKHFTALDLAVMKGNTEMVTFLIENKSIIHDSIAKGFNVVNLALKSNNHETKKLIKSTGIKPNPMPYVNSVGLGMFYTNNISDGFLGGSINFHEDKYNVDVNLRVAMRLNEYQVPRTISYYEEERFYETRYFGGVGITKNFNILRPASGWIYGLQLSMHQYVTWGSLEGLSDNLPIKFLSGFTGGVFFKYNALKFGVSYEYLPLPIERYDPSRINLELIYYLRFRNDLYYNILI